jgi:phosphatidate cytidylyltransferase
MKQEFTKRLLSSIILIPIAFFFIIEGSFPFIFFISVCFFIIGYEWHMMIKSKPHKIYGYIFLVISFYTIYEMRIDEALGYWIFMFITIICISTDIGGYVFGKLFKGPKLTKFSPNKTFSGMIGGYILSVISSIIFTNYTYEKDLPNDWIIFILIISTISQLGDIMISYFKRLSKVKDTGKIIPGHGGMLDRVDGMIFAFPFAYLIFLLDII